MQVMKSKPSRGSCAGLIALALALTLACGGEEALPALTVSIDPPALQAGWRPAGQSENMYESVLVSTGQPIKGPVYVQVTQDDPILDPREPFDYEYEEEPGVYRLAAYFNPDLPVGTYTGSIRISLCADAACHRRYPMTGGEWQYAVTVAAPISATAMLNGVAHPLTDHWLDPSVKTMRVKSGDLVRIQASEPAWFSESYGGAAKYNLTGGDDWWQANVAYSISTPGSEGMMTVRVSSKALPQAKYEVWIVVTE